MNTKKKLQTWFSRIRGKNFCDLENQIGYRFKNQNLKNMALTHKSITGRERVEEHNERLEFLGDSVFDLCVSDLLMNKYPEADEGDLSKMRSSLVNTEELANLALSIKLDQYLKLRVPEEQEREQLTPRLLACVMEALIGAVYKDGGFTKTQKVITRLLNPRINKGIINRDYKSILQEFTQKKFRKIPSYNIVHIKGPPHDKVFLMEVKVGVKSLGEGEGKSKKQATQSAALQALKKLAVIPYLR